MAEPFDAVKKKVRALKRLEVRIRFGNTAPPTPLIWDRFFDLWPLRIGRAKYTLYALAQMDRDAYRQVVDEYFAHVYYAFYRENGITPAGAYDPAVLAQLGLSADADEDDVKRRFRELAKRHHPDAGGDEAAFIRLMDIYRHLTRG